MKPRRLFDVWELNGDRPLDSRVQDAKKAGNLDFDARVPIPISVFPSTYRSDATSVETTTTRVEGEVNLGAPTSSRVGREDTRFSGKEEVDITVNQYRPRRDIKEDSRVFEEKPIRTFDQDKFQQQQPTTKVDITKTTHIEGDRYYPAQQTYIDVARERYQGSAPAEVKDVHVDIIRERQRGYAPAEVKDVHVDITRERTQGFAPAEVKDVHVDIARERYQPTSTRSEIKDVHVDITRERQRGYAPAEYKDVNVDVRINRGTEYPNTEVISHRRQYRDVVPESQLDITEREYRRRVSPTYDIEYERRRPGRDTEIRVEERETTLKTDKPVLKNKIDMGYYDDEDGPTRAREGVRESVRFVEPRQSAANATSVTIPCHFIRVGDLLTLQGRPCQVIRISMSAQTGQYRYLGVDLFTKQLQEESSFVSNPEPSVVVQSMTGPVFKQYRILDLRDDGLLVCMTENGDVKQGLQVVDQGNLYGKIDRAFAEGRGSVRALVINDGGRELVVDYKVINSSRL